MANVQYIAFLSLFFPVFRSRTEFLLSPFLGFWKKKTQEESGVGPPRIMSVSGPSLESHCLCSSGYYCSH